MSVRIKWRAGAVERVVAADVERALDRAGVKGVGDVKRSINIGHSQSASSLGGERRAGRSAPGEPPRKDTGRLFDSINHLVDRLGQAVRLRVSAPTAYATHLEFGTRRMAARPFLRPWLQDKGVARALDELRKIPRRR